MSSPTGKVKVWRLKKGEELRFKAGHPWVFSNELHESPKGIEIGSPIELCDAGGAFLARGFGNPQSLIAFRVLSRDPSEEAPISRAGIERRLLNAFRLRKDLRLTDLSFRLFYAEADQIPGLMIDSYFTEGDHRAFVVQAQTGGADRVLSWVFEVLGELDPNAAIITRNEAQVRALEGLKPEEPAVIKAGKVRSLEDAKIYVRGAISGKPAAYRVDLLRGQKTGFFLDQVSNAQRLREFFPAEAKKGIRALDLCCYVGQWGTQFASIAPTSIEITGFDASSKALDFARKNIEGAGARFNAIEGDVFKDLEKLEDGSFDVVFCDPPALISGRKHLPEGKKAYAELNTRALKKLGPHGLFITSSCSGLLPEADFREILAKSSRRAGARMLWLARGSQAPDHPMLAEFPEGTYLKTWFGKKA